MASPFSSRAASERVRRFEMTTVSPAEPASAQAATVVAEEPLEIRIDDVPLAVIMRTPGEDLELAAGFARAEGIIRDADDIALIAHCRDGDDPDLTNVVNIRLSEARRAAAETRLAALQAERATVTSASCGVCGKRTIESLHVYAEPFDAPVTIEPAVIAALPDRLRTEQVVFDATGGLHAAGLFGPDGTMMLAREDVGRHNAVDKVIGGLLLTERPIPPASILMVSGRTSFEIVQKALVARVQVIAAVSAPTSLAVELAHASRMTLMGFVRGPKFNVYSGVVLD